MARIDLARRAQIGRDRRARTRAELIRAARDALRGANLRLVTVDDVVNAAGVAKGTFYVHFDSLDDLQSVVADELAREFDDLLQPRRLSLDDPIERIAAGCGAFIDASAARSRLGRAHRARRRRNARRRTRRARAAQRGYPPSAQRLDALHGVAPDLAFEFVLGITRATRCYRPREGRLKPKHAPGIVAGILRAIGVAPRKLSNCIPPCDPWSAETLMLQRPSTALRG